MIFDAPALQLMEQFTAAKHHEAAMIGRLLAIMKRTPHSMDEVALANAEFEKASRVANDLWSQLQQFKIAE